jgi:uncharacterized membrane protein YfcA
LPQPPRTPRRATSALIGLPATVGAVGGAWLHQRVTARGVTLAFAAFLVLTAAKLAL